MRFSQVERRSRKSYIQSRGANMNVQANGQIRSAGTVKFFNPDKGYGFIRREGGQDVFVHANELRRSGIVDLSPVTTGQKLEFNVEFVDGKGPKAINISLTVEAQPTA